MENIKDERIINSDPLVLAYIGDAVFELSVRKHVIESGQVKPNKLHAMSVNYVRASAQAAAIKELFDELPEDRQRLVKRARNHKSLSRPKNADPVEYKWATAFEALIGYLHLAGLKEEMDDVISKSIAIIEKSR
ncbi:MAG: Mini-ribonuclease 3 [Firmicutes bacterium]|nr:Mini-ribonuclease 3 [Bacillota bacterium]